MTEHSDQTEMALVEDIIREKLFLSLHQEIPYVLTQVCLHTRVRAHTHTHTHTHKHTEWEWVLCVEVGFPHIITLVFSK